MSAVTEGSVKQYMIIASFGPLGLYLYPLVGII